MIAETVKCLHIIAILLALCPMLTGCGDGEVATPRRRAYPRIAVPEAAYKPARQLDVKFEVNNSTVEAGDPVEYIAEDGTRQLTLCYPTYPGARLYLTEIPVGSASQLQKLVDNRLERMALNVGGAESVLTELQSAGGFDCRMLVTKSGTLTPVQIMAVADDRILYGAFYLPEMGQAPADSVAPIIDAVARDLLHGLQQIRK